jgi:hypothetical protein
MWPQVAIALLVLTSGCSHDDGEPGLFFPAFDASGARPLAIVSGTLVEQSNCLFIDAGGQRALVLWEEGMGFSDGRLLDEDGTPIARLGEHIHGGGGWHSDRGHAEGLTDETIPDRCVQDVPEPFVIMYDVEAGRP